MHMKDNLRLHLDLLETQLARVEGQANAQPKFPKTVPLLERALKKGPGTSADQLRTQIDSTKREIASRKLFYAQTVLKRHLKQFHKVEPLRIAKRQKAAGEGSKRAILDDELKVLETLDVEQVGNEFANRSVSRKFPDIELTPGYTRRTLSPAESNVYGRFGKLEPVRAALAQLAEIIEEIYPGTRSDSQAEQQQEPSSSQVQPKPDDFHEFGAESEPAAAESDEEEEGEEADPFFEQTVGIANTDDESGDEDGGLDYGPTDAQGLPALTQGFISGSEDEFDGPEEVLRPERKNRRGQRARRKIWEQKFGRRANHILKEETEKMRKEEEKAQKRRFKEQRESAAKKRRIEHDAKPLHPSWEAKLRQKESQKDVQFKGKKVTFD